MPSRFDFCHGRNWWDVMFVLISGWTVENVALSISRTCYGNVPEAICRTIIRITLALNTRDKCYDEGVCKKYYGSRCLTRLIGRP